MNTTYHLHGETIIYTIDEDDFYEDNFALELLEKANKEAVTHVILELSDIEIIQSQHINYLDKIHSMFNLMGKLTLVCGFQPVTLNGIVHFLDTFTFQTYLNVDEALNAIQH